MSLHIAASGIADEIENLAQWEREVLRDLNLTRQKRESLTESLTLLLRQVADEEKVALQLRLNQVARNLGFSLREGTHMTRKVEAIHEYLAAAPGLVSVRGVQRFLDSHGLAPNDHAAATVLARKAKQGVVNRVARGKYRVNRHHPMIAAAGG